MLQPDAAGGFAFQLKLQSKRFDVELGKMDVIVTRAKPELAALPPDVRKGSAFPLSQIGKGEATPRTGDQGHGPGIEGHLPEGLSSSAHHAAKPADESVIALTETPRAARNQQIVRRA